MRILKGLPSYPPELRPSVAALGAFDGIHLAHAKILDSAVARARALGVPAVACTFDPHPAAVLRPAQAPAPIATLEENLARIAERGLDATLVVPFTRELARMEAEVFVDEVLVRTLGAREVVVGFNHTFGAGARGTAALLLELGARRGFATHVLPPLQVDGLTVSSSGIREALRDGDVDLARALLGRPYSVSGVVKRGPGGGARSAFPPRTSSPTVRSCWPPGSTRRAPGGTGGGPTRWSTWATDRPSRSRSTGSRPTSSTSRATSTTAP